MKALQVAFKDIVIRVRDRNALFLALLLPLVLIAIIGFAFGGDSGISSVRLALVEREEGDIVAELAAGFLSRIDIFEAEVLPEDEAVNAVRNGDLSAAVVLPDGMWDAMKEGAGVEIRVLKDPASTVKAGIAEALARRTATYASSGSILWRSVIETIGAERQLTDAEQFELIGYLFQHMAERWESQPIAIEDVDQTTREIDARSYFAPSFAVVFLLFTLLGNAKTIHEEREAGTYWRLLTTPLTRSSLIAGKLLGSFAFAAVQLGLLVLLSRLLFGVDWGANVAAIVVMILVTAAGATSVAVFIASIARTGRQTDQVGTTIILVMSLVGGSMWPIEQGPAVIQRVARFTFNYWAQSGFRTLIFHDAGLAGIWQEVVVILVISSVLFALSVGLLSRR
jgi:ABC-2 type transport system permease protein